MKEEELKVVVIGHIDHGKSTLIGRLMFDTGVLSEDKIEEIEKSCIEAGKELEFAYILDFFEEERKQGITIDTTQFFFKSQKRNYIIIDTPGHKEYIKNMITGASQAELGILIIDAKEGIMEQTKRHLYILNLLGIKNILVVINKMNLVNYSEKIFNKLKIELNNFFKNFKFNIISYIPVNALEGENLIEISENFHWYKGKSFLNTLDNIEIHKEKNSFLCFPIQDNYNNIIVGRLESGKLNNNDEILILPEKINSKIKEILKFEKKINSISLGESVGLKLNNNLAISRGSIITNNNSEIFISKKIMANIFWISNKKFDIENELYLRLVSQKIKCKISKIIKKIDSSTLNEIEIKNTMEHTQVGIIEIELKKELVYSLFRNLDILGRFVLEFKGEVLAGGIIID